MVIFACQFYKDDHASKYVVTVLYHIINTYVLTTNTYVLTT